MQWVYIEPIFAGMSKREILNADLYLAELSGNIGKYFAQRANLVRAIRLLNTAFKEAGPEVTSDILFFRKLETMSGIWFQDLRKADNAPKALRGWIYFY